MTADVLVSGRRTFRNLADVAEPGESLVGIADASTQGAVDGGADRDAADRARRRRPRDDSGRRHQPALGRGKANQYYLRGFNLDHGTDFATTVAGVQVNFPTHAHGHGYTDLNFVVPELVSGIQYKKGPYFVEDGDFTTAGSANINYVNVLDQPIARVDGGSYQYLRGLFADSPKLGDGNLLFAIEGVFNNGPVDSSGDAYRKYNGVLRYSVGDARNGFAATFMGYSASWNATDQVPRARRRRRLARRFGTIDPTDGGESQRFSRFARVAALRRRLGHPRRGLRSRLQARPLLQLHVLPGRSRERGSVRAARRPQRLRPRRPRTAGSRDWFGVHAENEVGFQGRFDDIHRIGLFHTRARGSGFDDHAARLREAVERRRSSFQNDMQWAPRFRTILGLRGDYYHFDVTGISDPGERRHGLDAASSRPSSR